MTHIRILPLFLAALLLAVLPACDSEDPDEEPVAGDEEVISNVEIILTPLDGGTAVTAEAVFNENSVEQSVGGLTLAAGTAYDGVLVFRNRFEDDPLELNEEITEEEDIAHQIFLIPEGAIASDLTVSDRNDDSAGQPLGSEFLLTVAPGATGSGSLRLVLRHYEAEEENEVIQQKASDLTPTTQEVPGVVENDADFVYPVTVQ